MLGINSNLNSLVAQQNLNTSQSALSQAITRLSSGKRINSAADDAAGLAISNRMQTQINGLDQGVSNANDGVSMIQTASSGLAQITSSLQTIRTLAVQASSGSLSSSDQAALQQEVAQQIAEVNRIASQTTYNGKNVLDGSAGNVSFQIGANVGQTIGLNLGNSVSAANLGTGVVSQGSLLGTMTGLNLTAQGQANTGTGAAALTSINVLADGKGGFTFTDQNNQALTASAVGSLFGGVSATTGTGTALTLAPQGALTNGASTAQTAAIAAVQAANAKLTPGGFAVAGTTLTEIDTTNGNTASLKLDLSGETGAVGTDPNAEITSIQVQADGTGGYTFKALSGTTDVTSKVTGGAAALAGLFATTAGSGTTPGTIALSSTGSTALGADAGAAVTALGTTAAKNYIAPTYPSGSFAAANTVLGTLKPTAAILAALTGENTTGTPTGDGSDISSIQILANGNGGYSFKALGGADGATDVTGTATSGALTGSDALATLFDMGTATTTTSASIKLSADGITAFGGAGTDATAASGVISGAAFATANAGPTKLGTIAVNLDATGNAAQPGADPAYTSVNVYADGNGGYKFVAVDKSGVENTDPTTSSINDNAAALFSVTAATSGPNANTIAGAGALAANPNAAAVGTALSAVTANNEPGTIANLDVSSTPGANLAIESIDNALATVNNIQATLGAAQNRFTSLAAAQQSQSTDLAGAQSQITDADFAQETANLSKAQVLQQAGISVLAQANSLPQQVLKLLQ